MKTQKFNVWFEDGSGLEESAISMYDAFIKAVHKKINLAENTNVEYVEDSKGRHFIPNIIFSLENND